jgi:hypothetical protein
MNKDMRIVFRTTLEVAAQPINVPLDTCLNDYTCTHFTTQNCIKQTLKQKTLKLQLVSHHKDRHQQLLQPKKQNNNKNKRGDSA